MKIFFIFLLFLSHCCSTKQRLPEEASIHCDIDVKAHQDNRLVSFAIDGRKLSSGEFSVSGYEVTSKGCAIIPLNSKNHLKVKSGDYSLIIPVSGITAPLTKSLELIKTEGEEATFLYCGEAEEKDFMYLKFLNPSDISEESYYESSLGGNTPLTLNAQFCAKVPRAVGLINFSKDKKKKIIAANKKLQMIDKADIRSSGFLNICLNKGIEDKVVNIVSKHFNDSDCTNLQEKMETLYTNDKVLFRNKDIDSIDALSDQKFVKLDLSDNPILDLSPLKDMETLKELDLFHTNILSLSDLPRSIQSLIIGSTFNLENLIGAPKGLTSLKILSLGGLKSFKGLSLLQDLHTIIAFDSGLTTDLNEITDLENLKVIKFIRTNSIVPYLDKIPSRDANIFTLDGLNITDLGFMSKFEHIVELNLNNNQISSIESLRDMVDLKRVSLRNNPISDLSNFSSDSVNYLNLSGTQIRDLNFIQNISNVQVLMINTCSIEDLRPLTGLPIDSFSYNKAKNIRYCPTENVSSAVKLFCDQFNQNSNVN